MTIYDIAKLAGVSASTVSRVVNGKPGVNKAMRDKIQKLLDEHHYVPDTNARNLSNQTNQTIGILTDDIDTPHQVDGCHQVEKELMRNGYYCFVKYIGTNSDAIDSAIQDMASHRVVGVVCLGPAFRNVKQVTDSVKRHLPETPVVMVHNTYSFPLPNIYSIGADEQAGIISCVDYMVRRGRRHLAMVINEKRISASLIRTSFEEAILKYPGVTGTIFTDVPGNVDGGEAIAPRILEIDPPIDGIICAQDRIAIGVLNILKEKGVAIPDKIALLGESNSSFCETCRPRLSSLDTMISMSSIMGARTLLDVLDNRGPSNHVLLQMTIIERGTT